MKMKLRIEVKLSEIEIEIGNEKNYSVSNKNCAFSENSENSGKEENRDDDYYNILQ